MKILVICQYYYPEPFRITDICEELVNRGHEVTVVTGIPNYPMGEIYPEYRFGKKRNELINGVKVQRCFTIGRKNGALRRLLNYYSFMISSSRYVSRLSDKFDVVFVNQLSPIMMAKAGIKYKKRHNVKLVLYCLDLWPESLVAGGIRRGSALYKFFHRVSERIYKQADEILISSRMFRQYFKDEFGITNNIEYLPQYAESIFVTYNCKKVPDENIDLLFAGNIGTAQNVDTIIRAANLTKNVENLRWHIVGEGSDLENCKRLAKELNVHTVTFYGRKPINEMPKYYSKADAMLVTMKDNPILNLTLPGKLQTYMAAGKPIIGAINGETATIIGEAKCGRCCASGDIDGLVDIVYNFIQNYKNADFSKNALLYNSENFSKEKFMDKIQDVLFSQISVQSKYFGDNDD